MYELKEVSAKRITLISKIYFKLKTENLMNKSNNLDFSGTTIFCGLDVHLKSWRVNIRDQEMELRDFSQNPDPAALHKFLTKNYPNASYKVGYEAGFCSFGILLRSNVL